MRRFAGLDDRELTALLSGKAPADRAELDELASFFSETATAFEEAPDESIEARHLAAVKQAAQRPVSEDPQPTTARRKPMSFALKIAIAAAVLLAGFSGAAYAGALPGQVQDPVANLGDNLGVSLPGGDEENDVDDGQQTNVDEGPQNGVDEGRRDDLGDGSVGQVDEPEQADKDDGPVADKDDGSQGNTDDGARGNTDEGAKDDQDDGAQGDSDDGAQGDSDDGPDGDRKVDEQEGPQDDENTPLKGGQQSRGEQGDGQGESGSGQQGEND
jgi:hypothetical protein